MSEAVKFVLIVAMHREIQPLLRYCQPVDGSLALKAPAEAAGAVSDPRRLYRYKDAMVVCSGPGYENAALAAQQAIEAYSPKMVISVGFAGALVPEMKVGDIFIPRHIISESNGSDFTAPRGQGVLVTAETVAGEEHKRALFTRFQAQAVDMEAAAVAAVAAAQHCEFFALKVISDTLNSGVDFVTAFVRPEGFRVGAFLAHVSVRPWLWPEVRALQRNSARAADNLSHTLRVLYRFQGRCAPA
jgi:adenosylhomocysteine nucleosidase